MPISPLITHASVARLYIETTLYCTERMAPAPVAIPFSVPPTGAVITAGLDASIKVKLITVPIGNGTVALSGIVTIMPPPLVSISKISEASVRAKVLLVEMVVIAGMAASTVNVFAPSSYASVIPSPATSNPLTRSSTLSSV